MNQLPEIQDSIAVGRRVDGDEKIVLFVQLNPEQTLNKELETAIKRTLRAQCSPRHVPSEIYTLTEIPKTKSGKQIGRAHV